MKAIQSARLLHDGLCPFCLKSVAILKHLDWLGRLCCLDVRDSAVLTAINVPLDPDLLLKEMHLVTPDAKHVYHGFGAFRWLAWRLPLLWPIAPFLYVHGVPNLGQKVYLWIARNRYGLVSCRQGMCMLPPRER